MQCGGRYIEEDAFNAEGGGREDGCDKRAVLERTVAGSTVSTRRPVAESTILIAKWMVSIFDFNNLIII